MDASNLDLKNFNEACEDFLNGKYILAEPKISSVLKAISVSEKLKNIIAICIENYNFATAFKNAVGENHIISLPDDAKGIVAFCFSLLYNIDNKNLNFFDFLGTYYGYNDLDSIESYKSFATSIILPFKEAINNVYERTHVLVDSVDYQSNIYNKIRRIAEMVLKDVDSLKLKDVCKEEFEIVIHAMIDACKRNDRETVYALLVALDYFSMANKKTKIVYEQFKECFDQ